MRRLRHDEIPRGSLEEVQAAARHPVVVIIENVRSAYNVGAILRTSDAGLIQEVVVTGYTPPPDHRKVRKTSLGAESSVPWSCHSSATDVIARLKSEGFTVAALELTDDPSRIDDLAIRDFPLAIVVGNEIDGVSDQVMEKVDMALEIPQYGFKQSLNVAVAAGVAIMGAVERFRRIRPKPT